MFLCETGGLLNNSPQPVVFLGHGSPLNAVEDTVFSRAWRRWGESLGRPRGVVMISAHWLTRGTQVTAHAHPPTLHDFYGFPDALYEMNYPAPGDPALAREVVTLLGEATLTEDWGLDHGAWGVLTHLFPDAQVPVVQVSLDTTLPLARVPEVARRLAPLRDQGVLVAASGNIVHNLRALNADPLGPAPEWARAFDEAVAQKVSVGALADLVAWTSLTPEAPRAHPGADHWVPLLYAAALRRPEDTVTFPVTGFQHGTVSMRAVQWG